MRQASRQAGRQAGRQADRHRDGVAAAARQGAAPHALLQPCRRSCSCRRSNSSGKQAGSQPATAAHSLALLLFLVCLALSQLGAVGGRHKLLLVTKQVVLCGMETCPHQLLEANRTRAGGRRPSQASPRRRTGGPLLNPSEGQGLRSAGCAEEGAQAACPRVHHAAAEGGLCTSPPLQAECRRVRKPHAPLTACQAPSHCLPTQLGSLRTCRPLLGQLPLVQDVLLLLPLLSLLCKPGKRVAR